MHSGLFPGILLVGRQVLPPPVSDAGAGATISTAQQRRRFCGSLSFVHGADRASIRSQNHHRAFVVCSHKSSTRCVPLQDQEKERPMGMVMIRCPATRRAISTGIEIDSVTFRSMPVFFSRTFCPLCRLAHEWFAKDAWVCDAVVADSDPACEQQVA